jgi:hypothetical protein
MMMRLAQCIRRIAINADTKASALAHCLVTIRHLHVDRDRNRLRPVSRFKRERQILLQTTALWPGF